MYRGMEVQLQAATLDGGERSASSQGRFKPGDTAAGIH
jgi:hypothetical protein